MQMPSLDVHYKIFFDILVKLTTRISNKPQAETKSSQIFKIFTPSPLINTGKNNFEGMCKISQPLLTTYHSENYNFSPAKR